MVKLSKNIFFFLALLFFLASQYHDVMAAQNSRFECGGNVEAELWDLWDKNIRNYVDKHLIHGRLLKQGDTYALYNFQMYTDNMVSMARRFHRTGRLAEVDRLSSATYKVLEPGTTSSPGRRWICRGGAICNEKNKLLNQEVMLTSVQFLGLASSVANALALSGDPLGEEEQAFIRDTVQIMKEHLLRWGEDTEIRKIRESAKAKPDDVKTGSSSLFFTDKPLWMITIYAELSGILQSRDRQYANAITLTDGEKKQLQRHLSALLQLFSARISFLRDVKGRLGNAVLADLDRGYWRLYADNRYAGYEGERKPVVCSSLKNGKGGFKMDVQVPPDKVPKRQDTGWDISHARRLVHALDALERSRDTMKSVFHLKDEQLPGLELASTFANTLVAVVWNGDTAKPLFSNYWSGANGWYRVAYGSTTGRCWEGDPPYGLTDSFPTGGYIAWAQYKPVIGQLGRRLYDLIATPKGIGSPFIFKYYQVLSPSASPQEYNLAKFMFLPSLVGVGIK